MDNIASQEGLEFEDDVKRSVNPVTATITHRSGGHGISGRIHFKSNVVDYRVSREDVCKAQNAAGYHPAGYDFFGLNVYKVDGGWEATWSCSASCD